MIGLYTKCFDMRDWIKVILMHNTGYCETKWLVQDIIFLLNNNARHVLVKQITLLPGLTADILSDHIKCKFYKEIQRQIN